MKSALLVLLTAVLLVPVSPALADEPPSAPPGQSGPEQPEHPVAPEEPAVWAGVPGTNEAHDAFGYPWPAAPDCNESSVSTGSCVNDGLGFFQGQCTSWVAHRLGQRNGFTFSNWYRGVHWGDAADWARAARSLKIKPDEVPAAGAVGWYARGHVSYVESVNTDGSIVISEMNTDGHNGFHLVTVRPGGTGWPDKFIHLADVVPVDYTAPDAPAAVVATTVPEGVDLTWEQSADNVATASYTVLRNGIEVATTSTPGFRDTQASPGQAYAYSVTARDAAGNVSAAATTVLRQDAPAPRRLGRDFLSGSARLVAVGGRELVCGRLGTLAHQRVGCRVRTRNGTRLVRTGRDVPWGASSTQVFLAGDDDRVWFCRSLPARGAGQACLPFSTGSRAWGYDRHDRARQPLVDASWVRTPGGPARCGLVADRAVCSVMTDSGWQAPRRAEHARPGDPLSRVFVTTDRGVAFCRVVEARAACTELGGQGVWRATVSRGQDVSHGRWIAGARGPLLRPLGGGPALVVTRTR